MTYSHGKRFSCQSERSWYAVCTVCTAIQLQVPLHENMNSYIVSCEALTCVIPQTLQIDGDIISPQVSAMCKPQEDWA